MLYLRVERPTGCRLQSALHLLRQPCAMAVQELLFVSKKAIFKPPKAIRLLCRPRVMNGPHPRASSCAASSIHKWRLRAHSRTKFGAVRGRGGIPVCFPQFSDFGPLGQHGFARNTAFEVLSSAPSTVSLVLRSSDETRKVWPHDFELVVTVRAHI